MRHVLLLGEWTPKLSRRYVRKQSPWLAESTYFEPIEIMAPFKFLSWGKWKWWPARHDINLHSFVFKYNNTLNPPKNVCNIVYTNVSTSYLIHYIAGETKFLLKRIRYDHFVPCAQITFNINPYSPLRVGTETTVTSLIWWLARLSK